MLFRLTHASLRAVTLNVTFICTRRLSGVVYYGIGRRRGMQLYQNDGFLAASTADDTAVFDEDSENVQTSVEPMPASCMALRDGPTTDSEVTSGLVTFLSPERRGVEGIDAVQLSRLLTEQNGTSADTVVVDSRPYLAYSSSHVVGAHNVCFPSLLERRRLRRQAGGSGGHLPPIPLENIVRCDEVRQAVVEGRCRCVVVYDEETDCIHWPVDVDIGCRMTSGSQLISVLLSLADCTNCELHFLQGLLTQTCFHCTVVFFS